MGSIQSDALGFRQEYAGNGTSTLLGAGIRTVLYTDISQTTPGSMTIQLLCGDTVEGASKNVISRTYYSVEKNTFNNYVCTSTLTWSRYGGVAGEKTNVRFLYVPYDNTQKPTSTNVVVNVGTSTTASIANGFTYGELINSVLLFFVLGVVALGVFWHIVRRGKIRSFRS